MNCWGRFRITRQIGNSICEEISIVCGDATQSLIDCSSKHSPMSCIANRRQKICIKFSSERMLMRMYEPSLKIIFIHNNHRQSFYNFDYYSILIIFQRTQLWPSHYLSLPNRTSNSPRPQCILLLYFASSIVRYWKSTSQKRLPMWKNKKKRTKCWYTTHLFYVVKYKVLETPDGMELHIKHQHADTAPPTQPKKANK